MDLPDHARETLRRYALQNAVRHGGRADPKALVGKVLGAEPALRPHAKALGALAAEVAGQVNAMAPDRQRSELAALDPSLLEARPRETARQTPLKHLPGWQEVPGIVMRFAPNPNGPATLGHSRGMVVHAEYRRMYEALGKPFRMVLRFDDTDPTVKPPLPEAYDAIRADFEWLGGRVDEVVYASERLPVYYEHAARVLEAGHAYVCTCPADTFRALKAQGVACPCRALAVDEHRARWARMHEGGYAPGEAVLRIKTDIQHPDPALRDWVAFRIATAAHPRVGTRFRVWPLLDFESAIEDHEQGVTHIVRGKDLIDSERKQTFLYQHLGWTYPRTLHWGRVKVHEFGKVSKSLFIEGVRSGKYTGWDDVRLPTLAAMRRRGIRPDALRNFWVGLGVTERDVAVSTDNIEAENRKLVEPEAPRFFFVQDPVTLRIKDLPDDGVTARAPLHPDHPDRGVRTLHVAARDGAGTVRVARADADAFHAGGMVRLKDWGNLRIEADGSAAYVGNDLGVLKQGVRIIHWVPDDDAALVTMRLAVPDEARPVLEGPAEAAVAEQVGRVVQFERVGFARIEAVHDGVVDAAWTHE